MQTILGREHTQCAHSASLCSKAYAAHIFTFERANAHLGSKHKEVIALRVLMHLLMLGIRISLQKHRYLYLYQSSRLQMFRKRIMSRGSHSRPSPHMQFHAGDKLCTPFEQAGLPVPILRSTSSRISSQPKQDHFL